ncbi:MAG: NAD+ synthase [Planctomycetota bacterium JB042]
MRIAMAQIDTVVGDVDANRRAVSAGIARARDRGVDLVVFPEQTLIGYPLLDLIHRRELLDAQRAALEALAREADGVAAVVGFVDVDAGRRDPRGRPALHNAAAVLADGAVRAVHRKVLLPDYDVFFEERYSEPGETCTVVEVAGTKVGVQVCEDLWDEHYDLKVTKRQVAGGARVIVNLSASPFHLGKGRVRRDLVRRHVRENGVPVVLCNQVGGEDGYEGELAFDGDSFAVDASGAVVARGATFEEDFVVVEFDERGRAPAIEISEPEPDAEAFAALVAGVRDYAKRSGFSKALLGLSGGIDSALVACVAAEAFGPENVLGVSMPSRYSSDHSKSDARLLAEALGTEYREIPIEDVHQALLDTLAPSFEGLAPDVTEENLQARARGMILMALSNKTGAMLLSTGNKTEVALGYCTLYGDMNGGLMVISDVSKARVYSVSRWFNRWKGREVIPRGSLEKPPSAELRDAQVDPFDYEVVSPLVDLLVEEDLSVDACVARGYERELVERLARLVRISEYKRRQAAPGIRITERAFGVGRRMPIA